MPKNNTDELNENIDYLENDVHDKFNSAVLLMQKNNTVESFRKRADEISNQYDDIHDRLVQKLEKINKLNEEITTKNKIIQIKLQMLKDIIKEWNLDVDNELKKAIINNLKEKMQNLQLSKEDQESIADLSLISYDNVIDTITQIKQNITKLKTITSQQKEELLEQVRKKEDVYNHATYWNNSNKFRTLGFGNFGKK